MKFRSKTAWVAVAVASVTALAACSSSHTTNGATTAPAGTVTVPGGIGDVPLASATGPKKAGTITWAMQPGATPNWIFPVVPGRVQLGVQQLHFRVGDVAAAATGPSTGPTPRCTRR